MTERGPTARADSAAEETESSSRAPTASESRSEEQSRDASARRPTLRSQRVREMNGKRVRVRPPVGGVVPRVEKGEAHREFVEAVEPDAVMCNVLAARRIVKDGETAESWFPAGTTVITTTTIPDDDLARLSWEREAEIVESFGPDYHIPTDYPVYGDDKPYQRIDGCRQCARGTRWMREELPATIGIIPLVKGTTPDERAICERSAAKLYPDVLAVYASQYFSAGGGGGRSRLVEDVEAIARETDDMPILIVGSASPWVLKELPECVVAGAGLRAWREPVAPRSSNPAEMRESYGELAGEVKEAILGAHAGAESAAMEGEG